MKAKAKWLLMGAIALTTGAAIGAWSSRTVGRGFSAAVWPDEKQVQNGVRLEMADQIVEGKMLSGKTRAQVVEMLGEPPPIGYFRTWDMVYYLGDERGYMSIDSEWLVVRLDKEGNVSEYRIVRD